MKTVLIILIIIVLTIFFIPKRNSSIERKSSPKSSKRLQLKDDFDIWISVLEKDYNNIRHFEIYGSKAALLWSENVDVVEVVCLTRFTNGIPQTTKYDHFQFNKKGGYWTGTEPKGCKAIIRDEISEISQ